MELELINFDLEFPTNNFNSQINLPFNFLIKKHFFRDNSTLEYKLLRVGFPGRYPE